MLTSFIILYLGYSAADVSKSPLQGSQSTSSNVVSVPSFGEYRSTLSGTIGFSRMPGHLSTLGCRAGTQQPSLSSQMRLS
jgi:hypothetical protein